MNVLEEILKWSGDRPGWQRDALRRLVVNGALNDEDYEALTTICKSAHGLDERVPFDPLTKNHIPSDKRDVGAVSLKDISHHDGVNALAPEQTIPFGAQLTIIYGDNAAGKSGYTRILKSACQARGAEEILGNVLSGTAPASPSASIRFTVGDGDLQKWPTDIDASDLLSRVSVFDSHSAAVYLREKTNVAFRPFGLDLFDKLSAACHQVQRRLDRDLRALGGKAAMPELAEETAAQKLISGISSLTKPDQVTSLARLSDEEKKKLELLKKQLTDLRAQNPLKAARDLKLRASRFRSLVEHLKKVDDVFDTDKLKAVFGAQEELKTKNEQAKKIREETFSGQLLEGTGSENWREMWEAARIFSERDAYTNELFPFTDEQAFCVLCQQSIGKDAAARLSQFEKFVVSQAEKELRDARDHYLHLRQAIVGLIIQDEKTKQLLAEIQVEDSDLALTTEASLNDVVTLSSFVKAALDSEKGRPPDPPTYNSARTQVEALVAQLDQRIEALEKQGGEKEITNLSLELDELQAREILGRNEQLILDEIERLKRVAAFGLCSQETKMS